MAVEIVLHTLHGFLPQLATIAQLRDEVRVADGLAAEAGLGHSPPLEVALDSIEQHGTTPTRLFLFRSQLNSYLSTAKTYAIGIFMENTGPRAELERLIREQREDYAGLSRMLGRNAAYVQQFIKRGVPRKLAEDDRRKLAHYFGVDESLLGGAAAQPQPASGLIAVPRFDVRASAGPGSFAESEQAVSHLGFDPSFLKQLCDATPSDLSIIRVEGDSMIPTLSDGDDILVDRSAAGARIHDGIYVLRRDDTLMVKRVAAHPGGRRLTISSDNPSYPTWADCEPDEVAVLGRVVWAGRKIR